jgi:hypothetical protein
MMESLYFFFHLCAPFVFCFDDAYILNILDIELVRGWIYFILSKNIDILKRTVFLASEDSQDIAIMFSYKQIFYL